MSINFRLRNQIEMLSHTLTPLKVLAESKKAINGHLEGTKGNTGADRHWNTLFEDFLYSKYYAKYRQFSYSSLT